MSSIPTSQQITGPQSYAIGSPIGSTTATEAEGLGFGDVLRILKQRRLLILVTSIVLYALIVIATILIARFAPLYASEAIFELEPPKGGEALAPEDQEVNPKYMDQLLQTEASKLKNLGLILEVVSQQEVKDTKYYQWYANAPEVAVELQDDLVCVPIPNTRLIRVSFSCADKNEARTIVQNVVNRYQATFVDQSAEERRVQTEGLRNTLAKLETEREQLRNEITRFRETSAVPAIETRRNESRQHVMFLRTQLGELDAAIAAYQSQLDALAGVDPSLIPLTAEQQLIIESDPILRYWRSQVESLDVEIETLSKQFGPNHRMMETLQRRRQGYYDKEVAKREELIETVRRRQIELLQQYVAQTRAVQDRLLEQLGQVEAEERDLDRNLMTFTQMMEDEQLLMMRIGEVQLKLTESEHAQRDPSRVQLRLLQPPQLAIEPSRPNYPIYLIGGVLLAIAGGIGLAFLRELTDQAVRTPVDVARFCRLSVLGCIPLLDDEEADVEQIEDTVRLAPHSLIAEAFRRTRTNLQFSGPSEKQRSLLITSPGPEDGKTAVAINLATTLAHGNSRVLLIDCNFRRPAIRSAFAGTRPEGLSNVLIGEGTLEDFVTKTDLPNLDVLSSGPMPPTPAELLGSPQMRALIGHASEKYERVILDGPPTLLISDTTVLAMQVDGVILVARAEENTRGLVRRAREQLDGINARLVGAILNGVKTRSGGYFKAQYREFYDYVSDETIPAELPVPAPRSDSPRGDED